MLCVLRCAGASERCEEIIGAQTRGNTHCAGHLLYGTPIRRAFTFSAFPLTLQEKRNEAILSTVILFIPPPPPRVLFHLPNTFPPPSPFQIIPSTFSAIRETSYPPVLFDMQNMTHILTSQKQLSVILEPGKR